MPIVGSLYGLNLLHRWQISKTNFLPMQLPSVYPLLIPDICWSCIYKSTLLSTRNQKFGMRKTRRAQLAEGSSSKLKGKKLVEK